MLKLSKKIVVAATLFTSAVSIGISCTAVTIVGQDGKTISGRTMEWGPDWNWDLIYMPEDTEHKLTAPADLDLATDSYESKYSVLATGLAGKGQVAVLDGQNSAGLGLSANYLPGFTKYEKVTKSDKKYASVFEITTFILSQFSNVADVKKALQEYRVWSNKSINVQGIAPDIHFLITDKSGDGIVVEYVNGKANIHNVKTSVKVMTNSPTYDWHLINLRNYLNLSDKTVTRINISDELSKSKVQQQVGGLGQGNGFLGLPGDYSPTSRFVKMSVLGYYTHMSKTDESTASRVSHILHNVDIPKGAVSEKENGKLVYDHTAYVAIKDLSDNVLYLSSYKRPMSTVKVSLDDLDNSDSGAFAKHIDDLPYPNMDISSQLLVDEDNKIQDAAVV